MNINKLKKCKYIKYLKAKENVRQEFKTTLNFLTFMRIYYIDRMIKRNFKDLEYVKDLQNLRKETENKFAFLKTK